MTCILKIAVSFSDCLLPGAVQAGVPRLANGAGPHGKTY